MATGNRIIEGLEDALAFTRGDRSRGKACVVDVPNHINVRQIRHNLGMTQGEFAIKFGFPLGTLRNWEQGVRQPQGSARVLLTLIERIPVEVQKALIAA